MTRQWVSNEGGHWLVALLISAWPRDKPTIVNNLLIKHIYSEHCYNSFRTWGKTRVYVCASCTRRNVMYNNELRRASYISMPQSKVRGHRPHMLVEHQHASWTVVLRSMWKTPMSRQWRVFRKGSYRLINWWTSTPWLARTASREARTSLATLQSYRSITLLLMSLNEIREGLICVDIWVG